MTATLVAPAHPRVAAIGPNWFASVMGTSIVATAAVTLPVQLPGLRLLAQVVWVLAGVLLVAVSAATVAHWRHHPDAARAHASNPVMAHFYGAPPMALLAFGVATQLVGADLVGEGAALGVFAVLWVAGTVSGLVTAVAVPYLVFTRHDVPEDAAFGGWLMPVVPPMVSAATGALLVPELPAGQLRTTVFTLCWSMFGLSLLASLVVITLVWGRLARHKVGAAAMVPTLWIVLGPLGQSITAANNLGTQAHLAVPEPYASAFRAAGLVYGLPVWGFALMWAGIAAAVTVRTARARLPFTLTWWSFTFPVGTVVTGTSGLAAHTGEVFLQVAAVVLFAGLLVAWGTVAIRTARGVLDSSLL
ncbi:TDT family transporter [Klenkia sp. PcliD-1-E]|uniref:TDT family transporter n=1 Tax=Klenkia sp. PcliD-1-E TaxID=2954492 RepID=UPI0020974634|nr:TDT family transporter [Klenkia sp. PcliD-1-E]MCO7219060.1 TDT family transporter [Klenkia sp. PcliD-1-E]